MKYLKGGSLRTLKFENLPTGTATWNLCRKRFNLIQQHVYRILGNGKGFFLWDDKILGNSPLSSDNSFSEIKLWMTNKGLLWLADICSWDAEGNWVDWKFPKTPDRLILDQTKLIKSLSGLSPVYFSLKDKWGLGAFRVYSVGHGYSEIYIYHAALLTPAL